MPRCVPLFFRLLDLLAMKPNSQKGLKNATWFSFVFCFSFGCRFLEGSGSGLVFCISFMRRLLEGSSCEDLNDAVYLLMLPLIQVQAREDGNATWFSSLFLPHIQV